LTLACALVSCNAIVAQVPGELSGNINVRWGQPGGSCRILIKSYYVICEDVPHRVPLWVSYHLGREDLVSHAKRTNGFRADPDLPAGQRAELRDYNSSGYDRGHMAPAADFKRNAEAMSETFFLSNMAPQRPNLNRMSWERLESSVRDLAARHGSIWIITGPLYLDSAGHRMTAPDEFIGADSVAVPTHFFKVILCEHPAGHYEMFAFIMRNQKTPLPGTARDYLVSVSRVEQLSGLDFFAALPDAVERPLEAAAATNWPVP